MEEKKIKKISLSTVLLILSLIIIIVMGIFMYKLYNEKTVKTEKNVTVNDLPINHIADNSNVDTDESLFTKGTYQYQNTQITFNDKEFNIYLDENFSLNGSYEIIDNKIVVCNILEYTFNDPEGITTHDIEQDENWTISFNINSENSLEVKELDLPDYEAEIIIAIFNLFETGNNFLLQS